MDRYELDDLRRRLAAGEVPTSADSMRLIKALEDARLAATTPSEYLVRVARNIDDPTRWSAEHPSLRMATSATNPADALMLAGVELRRVLGDLIPERRHPTARLQRAAVDAVVDATTDPAVAEAFAWALGELDERTDELHELRHRRQLVDRFAHGDEQARAALRAAALERLAVAGVTSAAAAGGTDGFDDAERLGLPLPCLAVVYSVSTSEINGDVGLPRFSSERTWYALSHRTAPRPMSRYETAIVSPLAIDDETELALRRISPRVPTGATVGALSAFRELMATELPGVDVDHLTGPLSPSWVRLPLDAIASMTSGTPDAVLDLAELVVAEPAAVWSAWPQVELVWISDDVDHRDGW